LPTSDADQRNCTIEVLQSVGGSESSLFAEDIFKMYQGYCRLMGFRVTILEMQEDMSINRGCKKGVLSVKGEDVYKHLKHESGVHKV
jgi:peptide chain release factor 1